MGSQPGDITVVCLRGLGRPAADWDGVRAVLDRFGRVEARQLPGGALEDVIGRVANLSGRAVVVGHSMGGVIVLRLAADGPDDVIGVILSDSFFPPALNGRSRRAMLADYGRHRVALVRELARRRERPRPSRRGARGMGSLARLGLRPGAFSRVAERVTVPVLVVHARDDHHVPVDFAIAAAGRWGWQLEIVEQGGHNLHVDRAEQWSAAVAPWLEGLTRNGPPSRTG